MKQLIVLPALLIAASCAFGQQTRYSVDHHTWAGGICCSGGVDYTIVLQFPAKQFVCFDSLRLETPGMQVTIADNEFHQARYGDSLLVFSLKFGSSHYGRYQPGEEDRSNDYGIDGNRLQATEQLENRITLLRNKKEEILEEAVFTESMTAYP